MIPVCYDAIVIGGGPGGSTTATYLARGGKRVLVLEKEVFPRFHIGESLLPNNLALFREMGVWPALQAACFPRKLGARFELGNGLLAKRFAFRQGRFNQEAEAIQVERAVFDDILLKHARNCGAEVCEGWTVRGFRSDSASVLVNASGPNGAVCEFHAKYLVDASGRGNFTGNQDGLRVDHPKHRKLAIFGHFTGIPRPEGDAANDIVVVRLENRWFWFIPISAEKTSVGLVMEKADFATESANSEEVFGKTLADCPPALERMARANRLGALHVTTDFSYYNRTLASKRVLRVGDAAGFLDPVFSTGVFLAMWSGKLAAATIARAAAANSPDGKAFAAYEKRVRNGLMIYWRMVENFYTVPFMELFLRPSEHANLFSAVIGLLAGEVEGRWALRWRLEYFLFLVKIQARWPIVPRVTLRPIRLAAKGAST